MRDFWEKLENLVGDFAKFRPQEYRKGAFSFLLAPILGFLFLLFMILGNWKNIVHWMDKSTAVNKVEVQFDESLSQKDLRIDWKMDYTKPHPIYKDAKVLSTDFFEYGSNYFSIYYRDSLIGSLIHFKKEALAGHKYQFKMDRFDNCFSLDLNVEGKYDSIKWLLRPGCD